MSCRRDMDLFCAEAASSAQAARWPYAGPRSNSVPRLGSRGVLDRRRPRGSRQSAFLSQVRVRRAVAERDDVDVS